MSEQTHVPRRPCWKSPDFGPSQAFKAISMASWRFSYNGVNAYNLIRIKTNSHPARGGFSSRSIYEKHVHVKNNVTFLDIHRASILNLVFACFRCGWDLWRQKARELLPMQRGDILKYRNSIWSCLTSFHCAFQCKRHNVSELSSFTTSES